MRKTQRALKIALDLEPTYHYTNVWTKKRQSLSREERLRLSNEGVDIEQDWLAYITITVGHKEISAVCGGTNEPTAVRKLFAVLMTRYSSNATIFGAFLDLCNHFNEYMHIFK